jgi:hypothetical protein
MVTDDTRNVLMPSDGTLAEATLGEVSIVFDEPVDCKAGDEVVVRAVSADNFVMLVNGVERGHGHRG